MSLSFLTVVQAVDSSLAIEDQAVDVFDRARRIRRTGPPYDALLI
jgi:hypothetical protein